MRHHMKRAGMESFKYAWPEWYYGADAISLKQLLLECFHESQIHMLLENRLDAAAPFGLLRGE